MTSQLPPETTISPSFEQPTRVELSRNALPGRARIPRFKEPGDLQLEAEPGTKGRSTLSGF